MPDPLVAELRRRGIPYVVKGLNRLFDSPEIQAVVGIFRFMVGEIDGADAARRCWMTRDLLPAGADWAAAIAVLDEGRDFDRGERWGVYNIQRLYLDFLEALGLREDTVPGDPRPRGARLLPARQVQPGDLGLRADPLQHRPQRRSTRRSPTGSSTRRPDYYADADADVGYATPDAVTISTVHQAKGMQWPAVFVPCLRKNRFPVKRQGGLGLFHVIPDAAIDDAGPLPRHGRGRDAALLRRRDAGAEVPLRDRSRPWHEPAVQPAVASSSTTAPASSGSRPRDPGVPPSAAARAAAPA